MTAVKNAIQIADQKKRRFKFADVLRLRNCLLLKENSKKVDVTVAKDMHIVKVESIVNVEGTEGTFSLCFSCPYV